MKVNMCCASLVLSFIFLFDNVNAGALKKWFNKDNVIDVSKSEKKNLDDAVVDENTSSENAAITPTETIENTDKKDNSELDNKTSSSKEAKKIVGDPIVLKINGRKEFRRSHIASDIKSLPPQLLAAVPSDKLFTIIRDQKLASYLIVEHAKKLNLDKRKEYALQIDRYKEELLGRMLISMEIGPKINNESIVKARYTRYVAEFKRVKQYKISHILCKTEQEINEVLAKLEKNADFAALAKEKSIAPSKDNGGDEGFIPITSMPDNLKDKIISLNVGEYTKVPTKTEAGFHIFKLSDIQDSSPKPEDEAKQHIKEMISQEELTKLVQRLEKQATVSKFNEDGTPVTAA